MEHTPHPADITAEVTPDHAATTRAHEIWRQHQDGETGRPPGRFEDHYLGHWQTRDEFAMALAGALGLLREVSRLGALTRSCVRIDVDQLTADLADDYLMVNDQQAGVHVFERPGPHHETPEPTRPTTWGDQ